MTLNRVQVTTADSSGISENNVVNTWYFHLTADTTAIANDIVDELGLLYEAMDTYKAQDYSWTGTTAKFYSMDDLEPRVPWHTENLGLTSPPSAGTTAREVALCLSFRGALVSGQNAARRRGRIYFGPFNGSVYSTNGRPSTTMRSALATAGLALLTASEATGDWNWVVYSPTSDSYVAVTYGWVDDEFDIQRRRGGKATARSTFGTA